LLSNHSKHHITGNSCNTFISFLAVKSFETSHHWQFVQHVHSIPCCQIIRNITSLAIRATRSFHSLLSNHSKHHITGNSCNTFIPFLAVKSFETSHHWQFVQHVHFIPCCQIIRNITSLAIRATRSFHSLLSNALLGIVTDRQLAISQIAVTDARQQGATQEEQESQAVGMRHSKRMADSTYNVTSTTDRMAAAVQRAGRNYRVVADSAAPRPTASSAAAAAAAATAAAAAFYTPPPSQINAPAAVGVVGGGSTSIVAPPSALAIPIGTSARGDLGSMVQVVCPSN
jgi:hypothetical protein